MPYAAQADLIARFSLGMITDLSDWEMTGEINAARVAQALSDASDRIDGYLADRYQLPLATVPGALVPICCDMAVYLMAQVPTDKMRERWTDALDWLTNVAKGNFGLGLDSTSSELPDTGGARSNPVHRVFTRRKLSDFNDPPVW